MGLLLIRISWKPIIGAQFGCLVIFAHKLVSCSSFYVRDSGHRWGFFVDEESVLFLKLLGQEMRLRRIDQNNRWRRKYRVMREGYACLLTGLGMMPGLWDHCLLLCSSVDKNLVNQFRVGIRQMTGMFDGSEIS